MVPTFRLREFHKLLVVKQVSDVFIYTTNRRDHTAGTRNCPGDNLLYIYKLPEWLLASNNLKAHPNQRPNLSTGLQYIRKQTQRNRLALNIDSCLLAPVTQLHSELKQIS